VNRWFSWCFGGGSLLLIPLTAAAQPLENNDFTAPTPRPNRGIFESPQNFAFEFRIGPYRPEIDDAFAGGQQPFADAFGTKTRLHIGFEFDWQALRIPYVGTLGPGVGFSYTKFGARAKILDATGAFQTDAEGNVQLSSDKTRLKVFPMYLAAVLRADVFTREYGIPIVPYTKLGLGWALWSTGTDGGISRAGPNNIVGRGTSWGSHFALGAALQLDFLDPNSSLRLDNDTGINHSYFYLEWMRNSLNGLLGSQPLQVGTSTWVIGLALEI